MKTSRVTWGATSELVPGSDLFDLAEAEPADGVAGVDLGALQRDHHAAMLLAALCWPVLLALPLRIKDKCVRSKQKVTAYDERGSGTIPETVSGGSGLTRPFSTRLVIMTMTPVFCSHTILQKSLKVDLSGPWAAM